MVGIERLTMGHQVIVQPELPIMSCVLLVVSLARCSSDSSNMGVVHLRLGLSSARGAMKQHAQVAQTSVLSITVAPVPLSQFTPMVTCGIPDDQLMEKENV